MKLTPLLWVLAMLSACGGSSGGPAGVTVVVAGLEMARLSEVKEELGRIPGVGSVTSEEFKDGQAVLRLATSRKGSEIAEVLARSASGLRNVKGFTDSSVQVSFDGKAEPKAPPPPVADSPGDPGTKPGEGKEVKVGAKKDPLGYKMHQLPSGSIAIFEGWQIQDGGHDGQWATYVTCPQGKADEFQLLVTLGTPDAQTLANLFEAGPAYVQQLMPLLRRSGQGRSSTFGGDPALLENYEGEGNGKKVVATAIYIKKKDVAVGLLAIGTPEAFKTYGRSAEIVAQSITFKETALDPRLVGTWNLEKYTSTGAGTSNQFSHSSVTSLTIYPNGTFTESSSSSTSLNNSSGNTSAFLDGGERGRLVLRGNMMTMHYDSGKTWTGEWKFDGGGSALWLNKAMYLKQ